MRAMHAGEVHERGGGQHGVARAIDGRHQREDEARSGHGRDCSQRNQRAAMPPVEEMPRAQGVYCARPQRAPCVQHAVCHVDREGAEREQSGNPAGQSDMRGPCEGQPPDGGHGGRIETGQMPQAQRRRRVHRARGRAGVQFRAGEGKCHHTHCRRRRT